MSLRQLRKQWDNVAATDPWRAILGRPGEGKHWNAEEFFRSGEYEIKNVMSYAEALGRPAKRRSALDFGCGAGRLTQALAEHFDSVTGVDVSPSMLALAAEHNRHGDRCRYVLNEAADLHAFADSSFDFVYSNITLQHLRPNLIRAYLPEFLRLLAPDGLLLFQLPSHRRSPWLARLLPGDLYQRAARLLWPLFHGDRPLLEMYGLRREKVTRLLEQNGGRLLEVETQDAAGSDWVSFRYAVTL